MTNWTCKKCHQTREPYTSCDCGCFGPEAFGGLRNRITMPDSIERHQDMARDVVSNIRLGRYDFRVRNLLSSEIPTW